MSYILKDSKNIEKINSKAKFGLIDKKWLMKEFNVSTKTSERIMNRRNCFYLMQSGRLATNLILSWMYTDAEYYLERKRIKVT